MEEWCYEISWNCGHRYTGKTNVTGAHGDDCKEAVYTEERLSALGPNRSNSSSWYVIVTGKRGCDVVKVSA